MMPFDALSKEQYGKAGASLLRNCNLIFSRNAVEIKQFQNYMDRFPYLMMQQSGKHFLIFPNSSDTAPQFLFSGNGKPI